MSRSTAFLSNKFVSLCEKGKAEISDSDIVLIISVYLIDQDVINFYVSVDDMFFVHEIEG